MNDSEDTVELDGPPALEIGTKVRARQDVRNDGTFPGRAMGEFLVRRGDIGYVNRVGTFLQRYYIYGVDFYEHGYIVGMRNKELEVVEAAVDAPASARG